MRRINDTQFGMMLVVNASSNIISGLYTCIEVILSVVLIRSIRLIFAWYNLKSIYNDRKIVQLSTTRLSLFTDPGLAPRKLSRASVVISLAVLALLTAGSFGIVGKSEEVIELEKVGQKVTLAEENNVVDLRMHISEDFHMSDPFLSGTILLLSGASCQTKSSKKTTTFGYFNELDDLTTLKWKRNDKPRNSTCMITGSQYVPEKIFEESIERLDSKAEIERECQHMFEALPVITSLVPGQMTQISLPGDLSPKKCPISFLEMWCTTGHQDSCAVSVYFRKTEMYSEILVAYNVFDDTYTLRKTTNQRTSSPASGGVLQNIAFLAAAKMEDQLEWARYAARFRIETNAEIRKIVGMRDITHINVALVAATVGVAVFIIFFVRVAAIWGWIIYITRPGRQEYNKFNSALDAISCAAVETFREGGCRFRKSTAVSVKVTAAGVGPVKLDLDSTDAVCTAPRLG